MNIGYVYNLQAFPPRGGNHVHALELIQGFLDAGHHVSVVDDPSMPRVESFSSSDVASLNAFSETIDVLYVRIDARYLSDLPSITECMNRVSGRKPVVWEINAPANETLAFSWLGGREAAVKESFLRILKRRLHAARKLAGIKREEMYRRNLCEKVDAAICVSSALGQYAREVLALDNIVVLPNGGPLISEEEIARRRTERNDSAFTVFYSGSAIYPWQGLDFISSVITRARTRAPDIRFVLAVNQRTEFLPRGDNVDIREGLNRDGILSAICCSDACVALHPDYPWSDYGFHNSPMKLFEYMACMAPVVTSNRAQMAELIVHGENGLLCDDTPDGILDQLIALRDNPQKAAKVGRRGWDLIQQGMNWKQNARTTLELFQQLVDKGIR